jgi:hypothetical protein
VSRLHQVARSFRATAADLGATALGWSTHEYLAVQNRESGPFVHVFVGRVGHQLGEPLVDDYAMIDTGADSCAFPRGLMVDLGITEGECVENEYDCASGKALQFSTLEDIEIRTLDCSFKTKGNFCDVPWIILGRNDFLRHFDVQFSSPRFRIRPRRCARARRTTR